MRAAAGLLAALLLLAAEPYESEILRWRDRREQALRAEDGWLSVTGLFWLKEGSNPFGTAAGNTVVLPEGSAAARAGVFEVRDGRVTARMGGAARELRPDSEDSIAFGGVRLSVIRRGGQLGIRMKDRDSRMRREFRGLRWFAPDAAWRITARFLPAPRKLRILNVLGQVAAEDSPGYAEFQVAGRTLRLHPVLEAGSDQLFFIFRDLTSGRETYGAGRFLYAAMPRDGHVVLDFNQAYNPPCAFTPYATCPLPPKENRLPVRVTAGEKRYGAAR